MGSGPPAASSASTCSARGGWLGGVAIGPGCHGVREPMNHRVTYATWASGNPASPPRDYWTATPHPVPAPGRSPPMSTAPSTTKGEVPQPATAPAPAPGRWSPLRPLVLRLHFYAGVVVAPFLLVAAVTGFLYAGAFQAERLLYAHELTVAKAGGTELPISE